MEEKNTNYDAEQEIDLLRLLLYVLHRWRSLMAITLVAAVLLAGVSVLKNTLARTDETVFLAMQSKYETELSAYEYSKAAYESSVESLTQQLAYLSTYQDKSMLANLNPEDLWVGTLNLYVLDNGGRTTSSSAVLEHDPYDAIVTAYQSEFSRIDNFEPLAEEMGVQAVYLKQLVSCWTDLDANSVVIQVMAADEAMVLRIQEEIGTLVSSINSSVKGQFGAHKISLSDWNTRNTTEAHLMLFEGWDKVIHNTEDTQQKLAEELVEAKKALKDLEKNEPEAPAALDNSSMVKDAVKFGIIGGFVGGFLMAAWYAFRYIVDGRIHGGEDLKSRYGVRVLGEFHHPYPAKHPNRLDAWLERFEQTSASLDVDGQIAAGVHILTREKRKILLTGAADAEQIVQLKEKLVPQLPELELSAGGNMRTNADILRSLTEYDGIILVEASGVTRYADVEAELSYIRAARLQLLGVVVL